MRLCGESGCDKKHFARGWCHMHYLRWWRHGDPQATLLDLTLTPEERFWSYVDKNGPIYRGTPCWVWTGARIQPGREDFYGTFGLDGKTWLTHQVSYLWHYGGLPEPPLTIDHRCHNTLCVNPAHLRPATRSQQGEHHQGPSRNNTSGYRGVTWDKANGKWRVLVRSGGKNYCGGRFTDLEEANRAAIALRNQLFTHNDRDRE